MKHLVLGVTTFPDPQTPLSGHELLVEALEELLAPHDPLQRKECRERAPREPLSALYKSPAGFGFPGKL